MKTPSKRFPTSARRLDQTLILAFGSSKPSAHSQLFQEGRLGVGGVVAAAVLAHDRAGVEEVDSEVGVVALNRL
jgi:hypothetical protein